MTKSVRVTHKKTFYVDSVPRAVERGQKRFVGEYAKRKRNLVLRLMDGPQSLAELAMATDLSESTIQSYICDIEIQTGLTVQRMYGLPSGVNYWIEER